MSSVLAANQAQLITFVILDTSGDELAGLGNAFALELSKNGGAFAAGVGTKAEIGSGWYSYELTASETDTSGPLSIVVTGTGADQLNLSYEIRPYYAESPAGTNILTAAEAAEVLRCETTDALMLALLPSIDAYIENATGHDWTADTSIHESAKAAARMLLVMWYENPAMQASGITSLSHGLAAVLAQLEALALRYVVFEGLTGVGWIVLSGAHAGDTVSELIGVVGVSGNQSANFASVIEYDGLLEQISTNDLNDKYYRVLLTPPA
jgi:hypothetical protein